MVERRERGGGGDCFRVGGCGRIAVKLAWCPSSLLSLLIFKRLSKENMQMGVRVLLANLLVHVFSMGCS